MEWDFDHPSDFGRLAGRLAPCSPQNSPPASRERDLPQKPTAPTARSPESSTS